MFLTFADQPTRIKSHINATILSNGRGRQRDGGRMQSCCFRSVRRPLQFSIASERTVVQIGCQPHNRHKAGRFRRHAKNVPGSRPNASITRSLQLRGADNGHLVTPLRQEPIADSSPARRIGRKKQFFRGDSLPNAIKSAKQWRAVLLGVRTPGNPLAIHET